MTGKTKQILGKWMALSLAFLVGTLTGLFLSGKIGAEPPRAVSEAEADMINRAQAIVETVLRAGAKNLVIIARPRGEAVVELAWADPDGKVQSLSLPQEGSKAGSEKSR